MKTLITSSQVLKLAFRDGTYFPPDTVTESDIAAAEQRYIVPIIGQALYEKLLDGTYAAFTGEYLATAVALCTRIMVQPRLDIRTDVSGTTAPKSQTTQPADNAALERMLQSLRTEARALLRRTSDHLRKNSAQFPEYNASTDILTHCSIDGGFVQIL